MPFKNPHPLYQVWRSMRDRCLNPNFRQWKDYGGRGITICKRWDSFATFVADMGDRPPKTSLDRKDNEKGYSPENCRWATRKEQQRNQSRTHRVCIEGATYLAIELAEQYGHKSETIVTRAAKGLSFAEVVAAERRIDTSGFKLGGRANGARQKARTHCKHGHEFTPENTYVTPQGWRNCRKCHAAKVRRQNQR